MFRRCGGEYNVRLTDVTTGRRYVLILTAIPVKAGFNMEKRDGIWYVSASLRGHAGDWR
jgi:hypothetical protein